MSKPNPIKNNSPSYHRRVLSDQTIVFKNRQYPVSYDVGSLVLVELLAEKNELHIQPLHVLKPDILHQTTVFTILVVLIMKRAFISIWTV